jgi:RNA polymerase-binding transcription factor DksA
MKMIDDMPATLAPSDIDAVVSRPITHSRVAPKWRWHYRTLLTLRERLLDHRADLAAQAIASVEPLDTADLAAEDFEHDIALGQLSSEQDVLYEIQAALNRIRSGTYGLCEVTGQPIPKARLRAVPWTRFCQAVEQRLEDDGTLHTPHLGEVRSIQPVTSEDLQGDEEGEIV